MKKQKALFLDRDGVINHDPGDYTKSLQEFTILPLVFDRLKHWQDLGYLLIIITNQGGIAKKLYTETTLLEIHLHFVNECASNGIKITEIYYCPHHPVTGKCLCRKPESILIEKAVARFNIDPSLSFFIGDKDRDVVCGTSAGVTSILIPINTPIPFYDQIK